LHHIILGKASPPCLGELGELGVPGVAFFLGKSATFIELPPNEFNSRGGERLCLVGCELISNDLTGMWSPIS